MSGRTQHMPLKRHATGLHAEQLRRGLFPCLHLQPLQPLQPSRLPGLAANYNLP